MGSGESICVIGLGLMGRPIAGRLAGEGFQVSGWNRSPLSPEATADIAVAPDLAVAADADILLLALADSPATGEVLNRLLAHLRPASLVVDMGSSEAADSRARADLLARRDVGWLDAPVSGGPGGAARGSLAIMAGGSDRDFARALAMLGALGTHVTHVGGPGAGHAMKAVNQVIVGLGIEAVAEALALAAALGFEASQVQEALRGGSADTPQLRAIGNRIARREYTPVAKIRTILKDLTMASALADSTGLELPQLRGAREICERVVQLGGGDEDCAIVFELHTADGRLRSAGPCDARPDSDR
jgi:3-hydroxyisobutyrate dehydrogenase-like beta-hydroxyacid dehydrogenase